MKHWAYSLRSDGRSPDGPAGRWLYCYKLGVETTETDLFVPASEDEYEGAKPGDKLWFVIDNAVVGCATLSRREVNFCHNVGEQAELYFNAVTIGLWPDGPMARWAMETREVPSNVGEAWYRELRKTLLANKSITDPASTSSWNRYKELSKEDIERLRARSQRAGNR